MITKRVSAAVAPNDSGEFDVILSNATEDRDGERLLPEQWKQPLPETIQFNVDHSDHVGDIVGSGQPWIDGDGNLRVTGKFASSELGQHIRALVNEGHLTSVSVEFLRSKDGQHELVGGAFVKVPSNPNARVLASKAPNAELALVQAIHDASAHLGAACAAVMEDDANKALALRLRLKAL